MAMKVDLILQLVDRLSGPAASATGAINRVGSAAAAATAKVNAAHIAAAKAQGGSNKAASVLGRAQAIANAEAAAAAGSGGKGAARGGGANTAMMASNGASMMKWMAGVGAGAAVAKNFKDSAKSAIDFESALTDIDKVADWTDNFKLSDMKRELLELSKVMPLSITDLAKIAEQGAAAGIATQDLTKFISNAAKVSTAFNITAEEAGESMSKLATIFRMNQDQVVKLADSINVLGDSTAAKERDILNVLVRSGANGKQIGLTADSMSALAAAMLSMGQAPEVVGTALNSVIAKLSTAGSASDKVQEAWKEMGTSGEAIQKMMFANGDVGLIKVLEKIDKLEPEKKAKALVDIFGLTQQDDVARMSTVIPDIIKNMKAVGNSFMNFRDVVADKGTAKGVEAIEAMFLNLNRAGKDKGVQGVLKQLGYTTEKFGESLKGDAGKTMTEFLGKLATMKNPEAALAKLGIKSKEAQKSVMELARSSTELGRAYDEAMSKLKTGTLDSTFSKRMANTKAQMQVFSNLMERMAINFGDKLLPLINKGMSGLSEMLTAMGYGGTEADKVASSWERMAVALDGLAAGAGFTGFGEMMKAVGENIAGVNKHTDELAKNTALGATFDKWIGYAENFIRVWKNLQDVAPSIFGDSGDTDKQKLDRQRKTLGALNERDAENKTHAIPRLEELPDAIGRKLIQSRIAALEEKNGIFRGGDGGNSRFVKPKNGGQVTFGANGLGALSDSFGGGMVGKPSLDSSAFDPAPVKNFAVEMEKLNTTVTPNVNIDSLKEALGVAERLKATLTGIGAAADNAAGRANRALTQSRNSAFADRPSGD